MSNAATIASGSAVQRLLPVLLSRIGLRSSLGTQPCRERIGNIVLSRPVEHENHHRLGRRGFATATIYAKARALRPGQAVSELIRRAGRGRLG
jgi:hypothetical protein